MPRLFRPKLSCFYCGCRSAQNHSSNIRQWQCEKCDALNYLDENGEITDPPPLDTFSQARYARSIPRPASPEFMSTDETLFCSACLQNQRFLTEALASYFPPSNAPDYREYEEKYPEFRKNLEDRYPQVCRQCEPRVRDRIRATGYAAKTDHLRRMMERSRGIGSHHNSWSWKNLMLSVGAIGWCASLMGQLLWDAQGSFATNQHEMLNEEYPFLMSSCLKNTWIGSQATADCAKKYDTIDGLALALGLLFIWWNPRWKEKYRKGGGRIVGLTDYYKLQAMLLTFRFTSWSVLVRSPSYSLDAQTIKAVHSFMIVFTILSTVISLRTVRLDSTPLVSFQDSPKSSARSYQHGDAKNRYDHSSAPQRPERISQSTTRKQAFPINNLAPTPPRYPPPYNPPTPPPDDDETDAMDWTPSQKPLPPASSYRRAPAIHTEPSPFYGHLPPAPKSQAHKLRNPVQPTFHKASSAKKENFFKPPHRQPDQDEVSEVGSEFADSPVARINRSGVASPEFAPPRFFPHSDAVVDTGLESIFSKTFSIAEEPHELRVSRQEKSNLASHTPHPSNPNFRLLSVVSLFLSALAWTFAPKASHLVIQIRLASLGVAAAVAGRGLLQSIRRDEKYWPWSDMLIYMSELCLATFLGSTVKTSSTDADADAAATTDDLGTLGSILLTAMLLQESWLSVSEIRTQPSETPPPPPSQPPSNPAPQPNRPPPNPTRFPRPASSTALSTRIQPPVSERITRSKSRLGSSSGASALGGLSLG